MALLFFFLIIKFSNVIFSETNKKFKKLAKFVFLYVSQILSSIFLVLWLLELFSFAVYGNWRFIRSCAFLGSPGEGTGNENFCTMRTGTYNVFMETCTCNSKDGCNAASTLSFWSSVPLLLLIIIIFFIFDTRLLWYWPIDLIIVIRPFSVSYSNHFILFFCMCINGVLLQMKELFLYWMCVCWKKDSLKMLITNCLIFTDSEFQCLRLLFFDIIVLMYPCHSCYVIHPKSPFLSKQKCL